MTTWKSPLVSEVLRRFIDPPGLEAPTLPCHTCTKPNKCCDYQPFVANFVLGSLLEAGFVFESETCEHSFQPLGLVPSLDFKRRHAQTNPEQRGPEFRCHFFKNGGCEIWNYRPGECSTYFCEGRSMGHEQLSKKIFEVETKLAQAALLHLGYAGAAINLQVDILNGDQPATPTKFTDFKTLYLEAWQWASQASAIELRRFYER